LGITFKILHSQEVSLEGYGFKIYMEDSQKWAMKNGVRSFFLIIYKN
jgi:hypothetical protein